MIAERFGLSNQGRAADKWWRGGALDLEGRALYPPGNRPVRRAFATAPRTRRSACSRATCTTCWPPRPARATLGLDPGLRTGNQVAVVDATGKLLDTATVYPHAPKNQWDQTLAVLAALCVNTRSS